MARRFSIAALPVAVALLVAACGTAPAPRSPVVSPPPLRLAPAALPGGLALQQRLTFVRDGRRDTVDALVEVDAEAVRVVVHAQGQVALRFTWDGETLAQTRDPRLPAAVQAGRVLDDLQYAYWPPAAIAAALPPGWTLEADATHRVLRFDDDPRPVLEATRLGDGSVRLAWPGQGFELHIASRPVTP